MNNSIVNNSFLKELRREARSQKRLNQKRIFPEFMDDLTSFIGTYPWQTLLFLSITSAILLAIIKIS